MTKKFLERKRSAFNSEAKIVEETMDKNVVIRLFIILLGKILCVHSSIKSFECGRGKRMTQMKTKVEPAFLIEDLPRRDSVFQITLELTCYPDSPNYYDLKRGGETGQIPVCVFM